MVGANFGSPEAIGALLLQKFLIAFEAASFLLLIAAVAAVVLARRRRGLEEAGGDTPLQIGRRPAKGPQADDPAVAGTGGEAGRSIDERTPTVAQGG